MHIIKGKCLFIINLLSLDRIIFLIKHYHHHHHYHTAPSARISLNLSRHPSLSSIFFRQISWATSRIGTELLYIGSSWCHPAFSRPREGVHRSKSIIGSSLLLQQCPTCLIILTLIVFVMGGKWPYSCCFIGCCLHDLFSIAPCILV